MSKFITTDPPYNAGLYPTTAGFLELANGVALSSTLTNVTDQLNTLSALYLSTNKVRIGRGTDDTSLVLFGTKGYSAIFNTSLMLEADRTFTFPNANMTFAGIDITQTFTAAQTFTAQVSAESFRLTGTGGAGHLHLRFQSGDPTLSSATTTVLYGDSAGNLRLKNGANNFTTTFSSSANSQDSTYTLPNVASTTLAGLAVAQTFTLANIFSAAGAASTPALSLTGTPFVGTGTTSVPLFYLNNGTAPTNWNNLTNGGTFIGVNSSSAFIGNFIDLQRNGAIRFRVASTGQTTIGPGGPGTGTAVSFYPNKTVNGEEVTAIGNAGYDASMFFSGGSGTTNFFNGAFSDRVGVNIGTTTNTRGALLRLGAGTATANSAPLKFTAGTLLTTPELGALEYVDNGTTGNLYFTRNVAGTITRSIII